MTVSDQVTLLALDTAGDPCTVALLRGGAVTQRSGRRGETHLEHVMPMVRALLEEQGLAPGDCDAFVFGAGPGAFTGLRTACTLAQGLALGAQRPVLPVGQLRALAALAVPAAGSALRVVAATDARMRQAYAAVYDAGPGTLAEVQPPMLCDAAQLAQLLRDAAPGACAGDAAWLAAFLGAPPPGLVAAHVDAAALLRVAAADLRSGGGRPPRDALPTYVRDQVALTVEQRRVRATGVGA